MAKILKWVGGKSRIAKQILSFIPRHRHWVEPFCGSLSLFFAKPPSIVETINDNDGELINFWLTCRDNPDALVEKLAFTPYSRELRLRCFSDPIPIDPIERAVRFFCLCNMSFAGYAYNPGWGYQIGSNRTKVKEYWRRINQITNVCRRLANVQIECLDFSEIIKRYSNNSDVFLYIDPPYIDSGKIYQAGMDGGGHRELADLLKGNTSPIMVSSYDDALSNELYSGWEKHQIPSYESVTANRKDFEDRKVMEVIWMNYKLVQ